MRTMPASASDLVDFLNRAKTPYHASKAVCDSLKASGYIELSERAPWACEPGQRAFVERGGSSVVAFEVGRRPPSESGFLVVGAHTDSPNLRLKPNCQVGGSGVRSLAVEPYGGVLLTTWLDRPLSLAGRVVGKSGRVHLFDADRSLMVIPSLAIHLQRDVNTQGLVLNPQQHLRPLLSVDLGAESVDVLAELLALAPESTDAISSFDLCLLDATEARLEGKSGDFICSGRIDNLVSCFAALSGLLDAGPGHEATRVMVLYDHEEVGSRSFSGAHSTLLGDVLTRLSQALSPADSEAPFRALAASMLLSADMAHAVHPNYPDKHDEQHRPLLGQGPVLKTHANLSYATDAITAAAVHMAAERAGITLQRYSARNDMPCGSTIGPLAAARHGIRTADVGNPMLAMHACRELCAAADFEPYVRLITEWYRTRQAGLSG
jgi:aspartyl aminopeptidase